MVVADYEHDWDLTRHGLIRQREKELIFAYFGSVSPQILQMKVHKPVLDHLYC